MPLPLAILAGTDEHPPRRGSKKVPLTPLRGSKPLTIAFRGRRLLEILVERLQLSRFFSPIWIVGPREIYGDEQSGLPVINSTGTFSQSLLTALLSARQIAPGSHHLALITSDILPNSTELAAAVAAYSTDASPDLTFWYPLVPLSTCAQPLGPANSKRCYRVRVADHTPAIEVLPAHLLVVRPLHINVPLLHIVSDLAYRSRTRAILPRLAFLLTMGLPRAVRSLASTAIQPHGTSTLFTVLWNSLLLGITVAAKSATLNSLARRLHAIFVLPSSSCSYGRIALVSAPSLALDFDTVEEVHHAGGEVLS